MAYWPHILALVILTGVVVFLIRPRREFVLVIRDGRVIRTTGSPPPRFVEDVERICAFWGIRDGRIIATRRGRRLRLSVAGGIDPKHAQVFQNAWENPV